MDGVILVHASGLMLLKLRTRFDFNEDRLFAREKFFELGFAEDCYA